MSDYPEPPIPPKSLDWWGKVFDYLERTGQWPLYLEMVAAHDAEAITDKEFLDGVGRMVWPENYEQDPS